MDHYARALDRTFDGLLDEIDDLRRELDEMRWQRDAAIAELDRLVRVDTTFFIRRHHFDDQKS